MNVADSSLNITISARIGNMPVVRNNVVPCTHCRGSGVHVRGMRGPCQICDGRGHLPVCARHGRLDCPDCARAGLDAPANPDTTTGVRVLMQNIRCGSCNSSSQVYAMGMNHQNGRPTMVMLFCDREECDWHEDLTYVEFERRWRAAVPHRPVPELPHREATATPPTPRVPRRSPQEQWGGATSSSPLRQAMERPAESISEALSRSYEAPTWKCQYCKDTKTIKTKNGDVPCPACAEEQKPTTNTGPSRAQRNVNL